ncbi:hypothetical protein [Streptomyces altiplanensis]
MNAEIRALVARAEGGLSEADEAQYQRLLVEWSAAVGEGVVEAA